MVDLRRIQAKIEPIINEHNLELVGLKWDKMGHQKVLEVSIQNQAGTLDLDEASDITGPISDALDEMSDLNFEYLLDIGSPGAEKEIEKNELDQYIESYVRLEFGNPHEEPLQGTLSQVTDETITLKYFIKGRPKKTAFKLEEIKTIRLAVKF